MLTGTPVPTVSSLLGNIADAAVERRLAASEVESLYIGAAACWDLENLLHHIPAAELAARQAMTSHGDG